MTVRWRNFSFTDRQESASPGNHHDRQLLALQGSVTGNLVVTVERFQIVQHLQLITLDTLQTEPLLYQIDNDSHTNLDFRRSDFDSTCS